MYYRWLDQWDEKRALEGLKQKRMVRFSLDGASAFPEGRKIETLDEFCQMAERATKDTSFYDLAGDYHPEFSETANIISFQSSITTQSKNNDLVRAHKTRAKTKKRVVLLLHHWGATKRYHALAKIFSSFDINTIEMAMSYHFERRSLGQYDSNDFVSANLGRSIQSMRQSVLDARAIIRWLKTQGYEEIYILGFSMGTWVASIASAHEPLISKLGLVMSAASAADVTWTGSAMRLLKADLEPHIDLSTLRQAWRPIGPENYVHKMKRDDLQLHMILAKRDMVLIPELSDQLIQALNDAGVKHSILRLNCGHYSLGKLPYSLTTALSLVKFFKSSS